MLYNNMPWIVQLKYEQGKIIIIIITRVWWFTCIMTDFSYFEFIW